MAYPLDHVQCLFLTKFFGNIGKNPDCLGTLFHLRIFRIENENEFNIFSENRSLPL